MMMSSGFVTYVKLKYIPNVLNETNISEQRACQLSIGGYHKNFLWLQMVSDNEYYYKQNKDKTYAWSILLPFWK